MYMYMYMYMSMYVYVYVYVYIYICIYIWGFPYQLISLNQVMGFQTKRSRYFPRRWKNNDWHLRAVIRQ